MEARPRQPIVSGALPLSGGPLLSSLDRIFFSPVFPGRMEWRADRETGRADKGRGEKRDADPDGARQRVSARASADETGPVRRRPKNADANGQSLSIRGRVTYSRAADAHRV